MEAESPVSGDCQNTQVSPHANEVQSQSRWMTFDPRGVFALAFKLSSLWGSHK